VCEIIVGGKNKQTLNPM